MGTKRSLHIAKRLILVGAVSLAVVTINFVLVHVAPGDPVQVLAGEYSTPEYQQDLRLSLGLDRPLPVQYLRYVTSVIRGDLGRSFYYQDAVLNVILERLPATLLLAATALGLSTILGVLLGVVAAVKPRSLLDLAATATNVIGYSVPSFWAGQIAILIFSLSLGWLPAQGMSSYRTAHVGGLEAWIDLAKHLILPATSLGIFQMALVGRLTKAAMRDVLLEQYVTVARSKGLRERRVLLRHALRNALLPVTTVAGMSVGFAVAGSVLVETVYAWPGIGRLLLDATRSRDYPLLLGILLVVSFLVALMNLVVDIFYSVLDPRIEAAP
jgi:peptide/nickel transport system permease protein